MSTRAQREAAEASNEAPEDVEQAADASNEAPEADADTGGASEGAPPVGADVEPATEEGNADAAPAEPTVERTEPGKPIPAGTGYDALASHAVTAQAQGVAAREEQAAAKVAEAAPSSDT